MHRVEGLTDTIDQRERWSIRCKASRRRHDRAWRRPPRALRLRFANDGRFPARIKQHRLPCRDQPPARQWRPFAHRRYPCGPCTEAARPQIRRQLRCGESPSAVGHYWTPSLRVEPGAQPMLGPSDYSADNMWALRNTAVALMGSPRASIMPDVDEETLRTGLRQYLSAFSTSRGACSASSRAVLARSTRLQSGFLPVSRNSKRGSRRRSTFGVVRQNFSRTPRPCATESPSWHHFVVDS